MLSVYRAASTLCSYITRTTHQLNQYESGNMRKDPFENRIRELNKWKATDELTQVTFDMGHEAALSWDLPAAYVCVVRAVKQDGTIQEKAYRQSNAAKRFMKGLLMNDDDYIVMTSNAVMDTQTEIP